MSIYEKKINETVVELNRRVDKIMALKSEYNYSELISGMNPLLIQQQTQLLDRLKLAKETDSNGVGYFLNYGDFSAFLQRFDLFDRLSTGLKEAATRIIEIENMVQETNRFILSSRAFLPTANQKLLPEHTELYNMSVDYLRKAPCIQSYKRANMRQNIIKEALMDLDHDDIDKAIKKKLIHPDEIRDMSHIVDVTGKRAKNFEENLRYAGELLGLVKKDVPYKEVHTKLKGTTFTNDETGIERQELLKELEDYANSGKPVYLNLEMTTFNDKPACKVFWGYINPDRTTTINQIGWLDATLAGEISTAYGDKKIPVIFDGVTGGGVDRNGQTINRGCNITLRLPSTPSKEKTTDKSVSELKDEVQPAVSKPAISKEDSNAPTVENAKENVTEERGKV